MIRSMTGYGAFEKKNNDAQIYVEIKSLNSRFFDFYSKSCKILSVYDNEIKNKIKNTCFRGNFQLKTKIEFFNIKKTIVNTEKVKDYLGIKKQIEEIGSIDLGPLSIDKLISMSDIYEIEEENHSLIKDLYFSCIDRTIIELNNSRKLEGKNIQKSLNKNLDNLDKGLSIISNLHKTNIDKEFKEYKKKISSLLEDSNIDKNRLYQEIAIMIDKQDVNEEIERLNSHLNILNGYLSENNEIGKKINFILQEIGREINTIASKSNNIKITYEVLSMKNQVEQIREQAQNIL